MKTLDKLNINQKKLLKNEELTSIRGGYSFVCNINCPSIGYQEYGWQMSSAYPEDWYAEAECNYFYSYAALGGCTCNCFDN